VAGFYTINAWAQRILSSLQRLWFRRANHFSSQMFRHRFPRPRGELLRGKYPRQSNRFCPHEMSSPLRS